MTDRETMKLALEALGTVREWEVADYVPLENAITAIRQALEQPDPVEAAVLAEREACAKACEAIYNDPNGNDGEDAYYTRPYLECAAAIRERMK